MWQSVHMKLHMKKSWKADGLFFCKMDMNAQIYVSFVGEPELLPGLFIGIFKIKKLYLPLW